MFTLKSRVLQVHRAALRFPVPTAVIAAFLFFAGLVLCGRLTFLTNIDDLASNDFETYAELNVLRKEFRDHNQLVFIVVPPKGTPVTKTAVCALKSWIQKTVDENPDVLQVSSTLGLRAPQWSATRVSFPPWIDPDCATEDPEEALIAEGFNKARTSPWAPLMMSRGQNDLTVLLQLKDTAKGQRFGSFDPTIVQALEGRLKSEVLSKLPGWKLVTTGNSSFLRHLKVAYDQTQVLNVLLIFLTILFFRFFMGTWKGGFLFAGSLVLTLVPVYGGMALANTPIDLLTNSIPLMVTVTCLEDFVFYLFVYKQTRNWRKAYRLILFPSFLTSVTTAIGFASLGISSLQMIARFGLWAGFAAVVEWSAVFVVMPALFRIWPSLSVMKFRETRMLNLLTRVAGWSPPRKFARPLLLVIPLSLFLGHRLTITDTPEASFPESHPVYQSSVWLGQERGWTGQVSLLFDSNERADQRAILAKLRDHENIAGVEDVDSILTFLNLNLTPSQASVTTDLWEMSPVARRLISPEGTQRALLYTRSSEIHHMQGLRDDVGAICPNKECRLGGTLVIYSEFGLRVFKTLFESLGVSLLLVSFLLFLFSRAQGSSHTMALILTSIWGPLALLLIFSALKIPIFYASSICVSILVGLSGDNAVQYLFMGGKNLKKSVKLLAPASMVIACGMILLTTLFFFSAFAVLHKLGAIMILGYVLLIFGDLFLLKGLLGHGTPEKK